MEEKKNISKRRSSQASEKARDRLESLEVSAAKGGGMGATAMSGCVRCVEKEGRKVQGVLLCAENANFFRVFPETIIKIKCFLVFWLLEVFLLNVISR